jgi:taurine--2-oxoglutarate transaminase
VFFTNAGADAVEHAVRMARLHTGRRKVLARYRSYHGGTDLAINLTGDTRRWPNDYGDSGVVHFHGPFLYRSAFHAETEEQESQRAPRASRGRHRDGGPRRVRRDHPGVGARHRRHHGAPAGLPEGCAGDLRQVRDRVHRRRGDGGFGRTGSWFAIEHFDVVPDLITFAKGSTSGYVPLGGVAINDAIYATFADRPYPGGLTYSGHPLATACGWRPSTR